MRGFPENPRRGAVGEIDRAAADVGNPGQPGAGDQQVAFVVAAQHQRGEHDAAPDFVETGEKIALVVLVGRYKNRRLDPENGEKHRQRDAPAKPALAEQSERMDQSIQARQCHGTAR